MARPKPPSIWRMLPSYLALTTGGAFGITCLRIPVLVFLGQAAFGRRDKSFVARSSSPLRRLNCTDSRGIRALHRKVQAVLEQVVEVVEFRQC